MSFKFNLKKTRKNFFTTHQNNLIQYVENNLSIILEQDGDFSSNLSKVIGFLVVSQSAVS